MASPYEDRDGYVVESPNLPWQLLYGYTGPGSMLISLITFSPVADLTSTRHSIRYIFLFTCRPLSQLDLKLCDTNYPFKDCVYVKQTGPQVLDQAC